MYDGRIILLDADVIIHFIRGSQIHRLPHIYESEYWILDKVYDELYGLSYGQEAENLSRFFENVKMEQLPDEISIIKEYANLTSRMGKGESAIMSLARFHGHVVASSNIYDVRNYCSTHSIDTISTLDLLADAYSRGILTAEECNLFIQDVRNNNSKLPDLTIHDYIKSSSPD